MSGGGCQARVVIYFYDMRNCQLLDCRLVTWHCLHTCAIRSLALTLIRNMCRSHGMDDSQDHGIDPHSRIFWHSFWHIFWHSFWHIFWHSAWHSVWHSFWHSFCHLLAFSLTSLLTYLLTFCLTYLIWHSVWHIFCHCFWHISWHSFWHIFWCSVWHLDILPSSCALPASPPCAGAAPKAATATAPPSSAMSPQHYTNCNSV